MANSVKTLRTCANGHEYYKTTECPTCPICEEAERPSSGFLSKLSAPARRALEAQGWTTLKKLSGVTERELLKLHGVGPATIPTLRAALKAAGLTFKK